MKREAKLPSLKEHQDETVEVSGSNHQQSSAVGAYVFEKSFPKDLQKLRLNWSAIEKKWNDSWILDSGASHHMTGDRLLFQRLESLNPVVEITLGNNAVVLANSKGMITLKEDFQVSALLVPDLRLNLLSVRQLLEDLDAVLLLNREGGFILSKDSQKLCDVVHHGTVYRLDLSLKTRNYALTMQSSTSRLWHMRLGHLAPSSLKKLLGSLDGSEEGCEACLLGKMTQKAFKKRKEYSEKALEKVHADTIGPLPTGLDGEKYAGVFIDEMSRFVFVVLLKQKGHVSQELISICKREQRKLSAHILTLRVDGAKEFIKSKALLDFLKDEGITQEISERYYPQSNGLVERVNRTLIEKTRCFLIQANLSTEFWGYAFLQAAYVYNRIPHSALKDSSSPFEAYYGKKPHLETIHVFGSLCFAHHPKEVRDNKLSNTSEAGIYLGNAASGGILVYDLEKQKPMIARTVHVQDGEFLPPDEAKRLGISRDESFQFGSDEVYLPNEENSENETSEPTAEGQSALEESSLKSSSSSRKAALDAKSMIKIGQMLNVTRTTTDNVRSEPKCFAEAWADDDWRISMEDEINSLNMNKTWTVVDVASIPYGRRIIRCKWVWKIKRDELGQIARYKSRLVACGNAQEAGIDFQETFAPVGRKESLRLLLAWACLRKWISRQVDVDTAFLYGKLDEEIYMHMPRGFSQGPQSVCKLHKSIYGLKQAPRIWYYTLIAALKEIGFQSSCHEPCLLVKTGIMVYIYVDDMLIIAEDSTLADEVVLQLQSKFKIKDLGRPTYLLRHHVIYETDGSIMLSQVNSIEELAEKFGFESSKPTSVPMSPGIILKSFDPSTDKPAEKEKYQSLLGSLQYIAQCTRPDIAYAVSVLSQFCQHPSICHWNQAKKVLVYLYHSRNLLLKFNSKGGKAAEPILQGYSDSDYAACPDSRRSRTGYVFMLGNSVISWKSSKQKRISTSTCEAEYYALSEAGKEGIHLNALLTEIEKNVGRFTVGTSPVSILSDNQSTLAVAKNSASHNKTKHIDVTHRWIQESVELKELSVDYVPTEDNVADIFTKALPKPQFEKLRDLLGLCVYKG